MTLSQFINSGSDNTLVSKLENSSMVGNYSKMTCIAALAANDIHHIHFNVQGRGFDRIHNIANDYYERLGEEVDYLAELSLENGQPVPNLTLAGKVIEEWPTLTELCYSYDSAIRAICKVLSAYVNALTAVRNLSESDVSSKLDEFIRDWNKEIHYKMEHRLECSGHEQ